MTLGRNFKYELTVAFFRYLISDISGIYHDHNIFSWKDVTGNWTDMVTEGVAPV